MKKELFLTWTERCGTRQRNVAESWNLAIKQNGSVDKKTDGAGHSGGYGKDHGCDCRHSFSRNWKKRRA